MDSPKTNPNTEQVLLNHHDISTQISILFHQPTHNGHHRHSRTAQAGTALNGPGNDCSSAAIVTMVTSPCIAPPYRCRRPMTVRYIRGIGGRCTGIKFQYFKIFTLFFWWYGESNGLSWWRKKNWCLVAVYIADNVAFYSKSYIYGSLVGLATLRGCLLSTLMNLHPDAILIVLLCRPFFKCIHNMRVL